MYVPKETARTSLGLQFFPQKNMLTTISGARKTQPSRFSLCKVGISGYVDENT